MAGVAHRASSWHYSIFNNTSSTHTCSKGGGVLLLLLHACDAGDGLALPAGFCLTRPRGYAVLKFIKRQDSIQGAIFAAAAAPEPVALGAGHFQPAVKLARITSEAYQWHCWPVS